VAALRSNINVAVGLIERIFTMPIYQLTPKDPASPVWEASEHKDIAVIRAPTEKQARDKAGAAWVKPYGKSLNSPWLHLEHVTCEQMFDSGYLDTGEIEILEPEGYTPWREGGIPSFR
jgi:hypothetical protein